MTQQKPVTFEVVREIALALPGVEEGTSYGTPAFRVRGKFVARLREDGETLVVKCDYPERDFRVGSNPNAFFITDHYRGYPMLLVRLAAVEEDDLRDLLELAWRLAPKRLLNALESAAD
jgi:hypothetical protein